ncbi:MAG: hypothetical protein WBB27_12515 [Maribacter sp.]
MKNILLIYFALLTSNLTYGQAYPQFANNHEVKFNIGSFLATSTVEGSYEYYLNEDTSVGGTLYFNGNATDFNGNFGIGPNLRAYFGYNPRSGFFAEAFGLYYTGENEDLTETLGSRNNDYGTTALGLGLGTKWATRSDRFTIEISGGLGRNINPEDFQNSFMYRAGLSLGFRF